MSVEGISDEWDIELYGHWIIKQQIQATSGWLRKKIVSQETNNPDKLKKFWKTTRLNLKNICSQRLDDENTKAKITKISSLIWLELKDYNMQSAKKL